MMQKEKNFLEMHLITNLQSPLKIKLNWKKQKPLMLSIATNLLKRKLVNNTFLIVLHAAVLM